MQAQAAGTSSGGAAAHNTEGQNEPPPNSNKRKRRGKEPEGAGGGAEQLVCRLPRAALERLVKVGLARQLTSADVLSHSDLPGASSTGARALLEPDGGGTASSVGAWDGASLTPLTTRKRPISKFEHAEKDNGAFNIIKPCFLAPCT